MTGWRVDPTKNSFFFFLSFACVGLRGHDSEETAENNSARRGGGKSRGCCRWKESRCREWEGLKTSDRVNGQGVEVSRERRDPIFTLLLLGASILSIYPSYWQKLPNSLLLPFFLPFPPDFFPFSSSLFKRAQPFSHLDFFLYYFSISRACV